jgi:hypothetical protein
MLFAVSQKQQGRNLLNYALSVEGPLLFSPLPPWFETAYW